MVNESRAAALFGELKLYYEEVRSVNSSTASYARIAGILSLGLFTYLFFGGRQLGDQEFLATSGFLNEHGPTWIWQSLLKWVICGYAVLGLTFTTSLFVLGHFGLSLLGRSRIMKMRYWRAVSGLRRELHAELGLSVEPRALSIQTGIEYAKRPEFKGLVPRPLIRRFDYLVGFAAVLAISGVFIIPALIFASLLDAAYYDFRSTGAMSIQRGWARLAPFGCIAAGYSVRAGFRYFEDMIKAQLTSPRLLHARVKIDRKYRLGRRWRRDRQRIRRLMAVSVVLWLVYFIAVYYAWDFYVETWLHPSWWGPFESLFVWGPGILLIALFTCIRFVWDADKYIPRRFLSIWVANTISGKYQRKFQYFVAWLTLDLRQLGRIVLLGRAQAIPRIHHAIRWSVECNMFDFAMMGWTVSDSRNECEVTFSVRGRARRKRGVRAYGPPPKVGAT
jgi:hypothetical protein